MKSITARCATALLSVAARSVIAAPVPPADVAELQLRTLNHRFVDAFLTGSAGFMHALAGDDFRMIGTDGTRLDRDRLLAAMAKPSGFDGASYDDVRVRLYGSVALIQGVFEATAAGRPPVRLRYTDVFHWDGAGWRLVGAQNTPLRDGVAKAMTLGTAPVHPEWQGTDPSGDDVDVLRRLNEAYVDAFRRADVAWYDAHLAADYVVTNGDGSFSDRAAALAAFSRPTFASHLRSFPVDHVNIRRFGDVALIEAENAYEMKDGRTGVSRYTDIWLNADGRWRCISAHITAFKLPS